MTRRRLLIAAAVLASFASTAQAQTSSTMPAALPAAAPSARPSPSSTKAAPAEARVPVTPEYRIGKGDKLRVDVYKEADLSNALQVRPDGRITLPLIGDLQAAGQTPMQLQQRVTEQLKAYVANPVVTVMVTDVADRVVYVLGEVNQPGAIPLKGSMTVLQALAVAGGFKDFANSRNIRILRRNGNPEKVETIYFNYKDALKDDSSLLYLVEGDTVVVP
jgi:polysaccharide export outer membrane protein